MIQGVSRKLCNIIHKITTVAGKNYGTAQIAPLQQAALKERCILVDRQDRPIGEATKEFCHEVNAAGSVPLHRAFSVLLFNSKGELLLQKRSSTKITFPDHFTNTCCSHPLAEIPGEMEEENAMGIRRAAIRRLNYELGISTNEIEPNDLFYLTRIYYEAMSNTRWGEHEIDYVLFWRKDNVTIDPNPDEVSEVRWMPRSEIIKFVNSKVSLTPWFRLMYEYKLLNWWDNLDSLKQMQDHDNITTLN